MGKKEKYLLNLRNRKRNKIKTIFNYKKINKRC